MQVSSTTHVVTQYGSHSHYVRKERKALCLTRHNQDQAQVQNQDATEINGSAGTVQLAEKLVSLIQSTHAIGGPARIRMLLKSARFVRLANGSQGH